VAVLLVVLVLLQGSDNEGLGLGGGGGMGGMMSARGSANLLSRLTAITATLFMVMSVVLTITASVGSDKNILESLPEISTSEEPLTPEEPSIPDNN
jgi:preprotein translocase subunit SecG